MSSLTRTSTFSLLAQVIQFATSIVSGVVLSRVLGPEGKGEVFLVIQYASLLSLVLSLGLGPSYLFHLKKHAITMRGALLHGGTLIVVVALLAGLVFLVDRPLFHVLTGRTMSDTLIGVMIVLMVLQLVSLFQGYLLMSMEDGVSWSSKFSSIASLCYMAAIIGFVALVPWGALGALLATFLHVLVKTGPGLFHVLRQKGRDRALDVYRRTPVLIKYGLASFLANVMMTSVLRVDTFLLNAMKGVGDVGIYSNAVNLAELVLMIPTALGTALFPHMSGRTNDENLPLLAVITRLTLLVGTLGSVALALVGRPLILLAFGEPFEGAYVPMLLLLPGIVAMSAIISGFANYISSSGSPVLNAWVLGCGTVLNLLINIALIPLFGINGAALASSVAYILILGLYFIVIRRTGVSLSMRDALIPRTADIAMLYDKARGLLRFSSTKN